MRSHSNKNTQRWGFPNFSTSLSLPFFALFLVLYGCAKAPQPVTQEVYIPVKCKVKTLPIKPVYNPTQPLENVRLLLKYLKIIEPIIQYCVEVENDSH